MQKELVDNSFLLLQVSLSDVMQEKKSDETVITTYSHTSWLDKKIT